MPVKVVPGVRRELQQRALGLVHHRLLLAQPRPVIRARAKPTNRLHPHVYPCRQTMPLNSCSRAPYSFASPTEQPPANGQRTLVQEADHPPSDLLTGLSAAPRCAKLVCISYRAPLFEGRRTIDALPVNNMDILQVFFQPGKRYRGKGGRTSKLQTATSRIQLSHQHSLKLGSMCWKVSSISSNPMDSTHSSAQSLITNACQSDTHIHLILKLLANTCTPLPCLVQTEISAESTCAS